MRSSQADDLAVRHTPLLRVLRVPASGMRSNTGTRRVGPNGVGSIDPDVTT